jgi:hypothetical protein
MVALLVLAILIVVVIVMSLARTLPEPVSVM